LLRRLDLGRLDGSVGNRQRHRRAAQRDQPLVMLRLSSSISRSATRIMTFFSVGFRELTGWGLRLRDPAAPAHRDRVIAQQDDEAALRADRQRARRRQHQRSLPGEGRELLNEFVDRGAAGGHLDEPDPSHRHRGRAPVRVARDR
jgi:hypothetical protein